jgi:uncharacterized protein involved in exopolysaccharide biosynthesis/Mrp family chromosome partitioning ATPase
VNDIQSIKRLILPLIKGSPFILFCFVLSLFIARKIINYTVPMYNSQAKLRLDDPKHSYSSNNLYKDFDMFSSDKILQAEVAVLKSQALLLQTLDKLPYFHVSYYRIGRMKTSNMYKDSPFLVDYNKYDFKCYDINFNIQIIDEVTFHISTFANGAKLSKEVIFGEPIDFNGCEFTVHLNEGLLERKEINLIDNYKFTVHSEMEIVRKLGGKNFDVVPVEEDVAVVTVSLDHEVPEMAADFVNALCDTYINDYVNVKSKAARTTLEFLDEKISQVSQDLIESEVNLEQYKTTNRVINTRQETETSLRKISDLKIQRINLDMDLSAIEQMKDALLEGERIDGDYAAQFGYGDLLHTELVKKMKLYADELKDLLLRYRADHEKVVVLKAKIDEIRNYLVQALENSTQEKELRRTEIDKLIEHEEKDFDGLPTREKTMTRLQREFKLYETTYNFLSEKRIEASIAASALISFHRIIQVGQVPKEPVAPNKTLITFMCGLFGLIISMTFIYTKRYVKARVQGRDDIEKNSILPIEGVIRKHKSSELGPNPDARAIAISNMLKNDHKLPLVVQVTSTIKGEGKSLVAAELAKAYADLGHKTVLVDLNFFSPEMSQHMTVDDSRGVWQIAKEDMTVEEAVQLSDTENLFLLPAGRTARNTKEVVPFGPIPKLLERLKETMEIIVIDSPATAISIDGIHLMKYADSVFYVMRENFTRVNYVQHPDIIREEYGFDHLRIVLNDAKRVTNFDGRYTGSHFTYDKRLPGFSGLIKHYYQSYFG